MRSRGALRGLAKPREPNHDRGAGVVAESALPASLFECQEPMVEAALMDAAGRVFLERLGGAIEHRPDAEMRHVAVSAEAIGACLGELATLAGDPTPDLLAGLEHERTWILFDLARHGTGLGRQRATHELRAMVRGMCERPAEAAELLAAMAAELARAMTGGGFPVVFQALQLEIRSCLARHGADADPPRRTT